MESMKHLKIPGSSNNSLPLLAQAQLQTTHICYCNLNYVGVYRGNYLARHTMSLKEALDVEHSDCSHHSLYFAKSQMRQNLYA